MQLQIRGEHTTVVESHENETVAQLKKKIVEVEGAGNTEFNLYCSGLLLQNDTSVGDLTSNVLELTVSLPGGMYSLLK
ncbi:hypothetical protein WH47_00399 [Habropoda laboriosa]|uniref:Ubiquitin-like domain-containing protein n=1 Tax=Habropoda laboriosa TaxID=597456 RepID=A0A0L7R7G9_9HYME|nr:PREDICTED: uncharacterized protein LOC108571058 [Habropoda laboriosa]KOC66706.1 hypothetical protein WH47_00399 [Habropoda laboriosa]